MAAKKPIEEASINELLPFAKKLQEKMGISKEEALKKAGEVAQGARKEGMKSFGDLNYGKVAGEKLGPKNWVSESKATGGRIFKKLIPSEGVPFKAAPGWTPSLREAAKEAMIGAGKKVAPVAGMVGMGMLDPEEISPLQSGDPVSLFKRQKEAIGRAQARGDVPAGEQYGPEEPTLFQRTGQKTREVMARPEEKSLFGRVSEKLKEAEAKGMVAGPKKAEVAPSAIKDKIVTKQAAPEARQELPQEVKKAAPQEAPLPALYEPKREDKVNEAIKVAQNITPESGRDHLAAALLTLIPTALGGLAGGLKGAAIGSKVGAETTGEYYKKKEELEKEQRGIKQKEKEKLEERAFQRETEDEKRKFEASKIERQEEFNKRKEAADRQLEREKMELQEKIADAKNVAEENKWKAEEKRKDKEHKDKMKKYQELLGIKRVEAGSKLLKGIGAGGGKTLPASAGLAIGSGIAAYRAHQNVQRLFDDPRVKEAWGVPFLNAPIAWIASRFGTDHPIMQIKNDLDFLRQIEGTEIEKGVLREGDWKKYQQLLASVEKMSYGEARRKLYDQGNYLRNSMTDRLNVLRDSGYDVGRIKGINELFPEKKEQQENDVSNKQSDDQLIESILMLQGD